MAAARRPPAQAPLISAAMSGRGDAAASEKRAEAPLERIDPLIPLENAWLERTETKLRARETPWEGYQRAGLVSNEELEMLRAAVRAGRTGNLDDVVQRGAEYARLYVQLLSKLGHADTIQQVLLLAGDLVRASPKQLDVFADAGESAGDVPAPFPPLLKLLANEDAYISLKSAQIATVLLRAQDAQSRSVLVQLLQYIAERLSRESADYAEGNGTPIALTLLGELLCSANGRACVWEASGTANGQDAPATDAPNLVPVLVATLHTEGRAGDAEKQQLQYLALFCLWTLTFLREAGAAIDQRFGVAAPLVHVGRTAIKHKVTRMVVAIFRNMLVAARDENATRLLGAKALSFCESVQDRKIADKDLDDDLAVVIDVLSKRLELMTSYDQYVSELHSGRLSADNPVHSSDEFFKDNAERLLDNQARDLAQLVALLRPSAHSDPTTLALACADLGRFLHVFDGGRRRLDKLGAKASILELVDHPDPSVKHHALQTLARLVSTSWR